MDAITTSIFDVFKIGPGPSSSHTIGPMKAMLCFRQAIEKLPDEKLKTATSIEIHLYGSLSATGEGHGTDRAITAGLLGWQPETCDTDAFMQLLNDKNSAYNIKIKNVSISFAANNIIFDKIQHSFLYKNTMIAQLKANNDILLEKEYYSIGGGTFLSKGEQEPERPTPPYSYTNMTEFKKMLSVNNITLDELVLENEKAITGFSREEILRRLEQIMETMENSVERGIHTKGILPGSIGLARKAPDLYEKTHSFERESDKFMVFLNAYALAAAEENAAGHRIVTAPTSGSAGVIPSILYVLKHHLHKSKDSQQKGLLAAAVIAFITKKNASISGAEVGCQGEIGVASSMAAALLAQTHNHPIEIIENAAEIALEHHLGMTCDPIDGYVQIPCIERNAVAAVEAYDAYLLASAGNPEKQKITFDQVVEVMLETGQDMSTKYKETSKGGLAVCDITC